MKKRVISLLLTLALLIGILPMGVVQSNAATVTGTCGNSANWSYDELTRTLTISGTGDMDSFEVYYEGESSAPWFDYHNAIETVVIENGVTSIGESAFEGCEALSDVKIPSSVTKIGKSAFAYCKSLTGIYLPESITELGERAFLYCTGLSDITIPDKISSIEAWTFNSCDNLKVVVLGSGIKSIGALAFLYSNNLDAIYFKGAQPELWDSEYVVFYDSITLYYQEGSEGWTGGRFDGNPTETWDLNTHIHSYSAEVIGYICVGCYAVYTCECGDSYEGNHREALGHDYDYDNNYLCTRCVICYPVEDGNIYFEKSTGTIVRCDASIVSLHVPEEIDGVTVVSIDNPNAGVFDFTSSLTSITLPETIKHIGAWVLHRQGLTNITVAENNPYYKSVDDVLFDKESSCIVCYPSNKEGSTYIVPDSVTKIGEAAFAGCMKLNSVIIGNSVTEIGRCAFQENDSLEAVYFKGNAPTVGDDVFYTYDYSLGNWFVIPGLTLYYIKGKEGWASPEWNGYPTATWDGENIPHEHEYETVMTEPTCTEQGYTTYTCECGDNYVADYVDALGHEYVDGVCIRCGEEDPDYEPENPAEPEDPTEPEDPIDPVEPEDPTEPPVEFSDVSDNAWYAEAVDYAVTNGLMNGTGNNKFEPGTEMTRAMLVTVLWRYAGEPLEGENGFTDVPNGQWYTEAVAWAAHNGIVGGVGGGKFDPDGKITREQLAAILYRYCNSVGIDVSAKAELSGFPDGGKVSDYAQDPLAWAVAVGLVTGTKEGSNTYLDPQGSATRAQVATILMRFIENIAE